MNPLVNVAAYLAARAFVPNQYAILNGRRVMVRWVYHSTVLVSADGVDYEVCPEELTAA